MEGKICDVCNIKKYKFVLVGSDKMCEQCYDEKESINDISNIVPIRLPDGLVAFWIDKFSFISKLKNQRYFKIPDKVKKSIIEGRDYQIIIREVDYERKNS